MDVTLPNGTIVKGIPDGTTKAMLATKLKANGMDVPDAWMSPKVEAADQIPGNRPAPSHEDTDESLIDKGIGLGQAALRTGLSIPGSLAAGAAELVGAKKTANFIDRQVENATPLNSAGQRYMEKVGNFLDESKIGGLAPEMAGISRMAVAAPEVVGQAGRAVAPAIGAVSRAGGEALRAPGAAVDAAKGAISDVRGTAIPPARQAAAGAARESLEESAGQQSAVANVETSKAKTLEAIRTRLDQHLSQRPDVPNLDEQGSTLGSAMRASYEAAKKARKEAADSEFGAVRQAAEAKEATGQRVETASIESEIKKMRDDVAGIPDLEGGIDRMLSAVRGRSENTAAPAVPGSAPTGLRAKLREPEGVLGAPRAPGAPPVAKPAVTPTSGKTFDQLELTRRYLNDIAYSGNLEGYPAIVRSRARDVAKQLDEKMQDFVPEFAQYKTNYAKNSEPLHSLDTRFGRAVTGTEGGLKADAYSKVAPQDLPNRLFGKKEGIDLVVDALAGGKNATAEARVAAQSQVDKMVENWILSTTKEMTGEAAGAKLRAPQMQASLSATPDVARRLTSRFESRDALEQRSKQLATDAKAAQTRAAQATEASNKMKSDIEMADTLNSMPDEASKEKAFSGYMNALARERSAGLIDPMKYKATIELVSRANTLAERTRLARKIAGRIAGLGTAVFIGSEVMK